MGTLEDGIHPDGKVGGVLPLPEGRGEEGRVKLYPLQGGEEFRNP